MFLFQGQKGTVLYTGDFRLARGEVARMELLHSGNRVKEIDSVYLDTTFCDPKFFQIPSREECLHGIAELVHSWITLSPHHVVWLNCKAAYGYEYLFTNLSEEFGAKVHVNKLDMFKNMPELLCHVTTDCRTQIHACRHPTNEEFLRGNRLPCGMFSGDGVPLKIISIKPSTMWFGERTRKTSVISRIGDSSYRACFSFHSSYSEIKDFLGYLQPNNAYPNVIPVGRTVAYVEEILKPLCRSYSDSCEMKYKPLGCLKRTRNMNSLEEDEDGTEDLFDDYPLTDLKQKIFRDDKWKLDNKHSAVSCEVSTSVENIIVAKPFPTATLVNFMECEESNGEDEEEEEEADSSASVPQHNATEDAQCTLAMADLAKPRNPNNSCKDGSTCAAEHVPKWSTFFLSQSVLGDDPLDKESSVATSGDEKNSQSPRLFSDSDDDSTHISSMNSSQSTHISEQGSQGWDSQSDTVLLSSQERKAAEMPTLIRSYNASANVSSGDTKTEKAQSNMNSNPTQDSVHINVKGCKETAEKEDQTKNPCKKDSQNSSDFEIPSSPGAEIPHPTKLQYLYQRLATGDAITPPQNQC
ncbi:protein artemis isoform X2 [Hyperolius riggenbachi]